MKNNFFISKFSNMEFNVSNIWNRFILAIMIFCIVMSLFFGTIVPIIDSFQNNERTNTIETDILYDVHGIYGYKNKITYFNVFPIIGGDRIFVIKSRKNNEIHERLLNNLQKNGWTINNTSKGIEIKKSSYVGGIQQEQENEVLIIGEIQTFWGNLWYEIYKVYFS